MSAVFMVLTNSFDPDLRVYKEAVGLTQQGHQVEILCWDRDLRYRDKEEETLNGVRIKRFFIASQYGSGLHQIKGLLAFGKACRRYLKGKRVDFLHCHDLDGMLAGWMAGFGGRKVVFDMHEFYESGSYAKIRPLVRFVVRRLQSRSWRIVYLNRRQKGAVAKKNLHKLVFLPNYPNKDMMEPFCRTSSQRLRVNYIGSVRDEDSLAMLVRAAHGITGVSVAIHGMGTAYEAMKQLAERYPEIAVTGRYNGLTESKGLFENTDVLYCVYNTDVPNWKSAVPLKVYEGILSATPVIVSAASEAQPLVERYQIGWAVDCHDEQKLRSLLTELAQHPQLLEEKSGNLQKIQHQFTWEQVAQNLYEAYATEGGKAR